MAPLYTAAVAPFYSAVDKHSESYDLPHVLIGEGTFWGKTDTAHLYHTHGNPERDIIPGDPSEDLLAFGYTNRGDVFAPSTPGT